MALFLCLRVHYFHTRRKPGPMLRRGSTDEEEEEEEITDFQPATCGTCPTIMKVLLLQSLVVCVVAGVASVVGFSGGDDRFIKKYAMMKVYESCYGPEVVKEVRKEMRMACAKCAAMSTPATDSPMRPPLAPPKAPTRSSKPRPKPSTQAEALEAAIDAAKFQQAILALSKRAGQQQAQAYQPVPYNPYAGYYQAQAPAPSWTPQAFSPPGYFAYYQSPAAYPGGYYPSNPADFYQNSRSMSQRQSKDFDLRGQLDTLTSRISGRVRNITCVMQELGYLDENMEPNYERIAERINLLPIGEELKKDMIEGITYCKQFSQCVPDVNKEKFPMSRELAKPMFFFRCYKHKKLEACVMKDVRDRYTHNEDMSDVDSMAGGELRSMSSSRNDEYDDMAISMFEFMYGNGNSDYESIF